MSAEHTQQLSDYHNTLEAAEELVPLLGRLWRAQGVPTYVWGQPLYLKSPLELLRAHEEAVVP